MNNLETALDYLNRGLSILPLAKDKKPLMPWIEFQTRQPTELEVRSWYKQWPECNIGIVTGKISNLTVIDCDSQAAIDYFNSEYHGKTPSVKTPKGMHFYFAYQEGVRNTARLTDSIDVRSEGGYVVAPPSQNGNGIAYRFINDLSFALDSFSSCFLFSIYNTNEIAPFVNIRHIRQDSSMWDSGVRDHNLFHTANCLTKGSMPEDEIFQVLRTIMSTWGEDDEKWINAKIKSAMDRAKRRERNLHNEVMEFINSSSGVILSSEVVNFLHCSSLTEKKNISQIFRRLEKEGIVKKSGVKNGQWRIVESDVQIIDWQNATENEYSFELPLGIHELVKLYPSNIAVLAGASNTGKTSFLLEAIRLNQNKHPITYFNSEMAEQELRVRLKLFEDVISLDKWNFKAIERSSNFADVIDPDGFNVIDYMEVYEDFYKIGGWINEVHKKLNKGIALIAIQKKTSTKKDAQDFGRGGELTLEKPRLYLAMDRGKIKIVKGKIWRDHERNPNGLIRNFKIVQGWKFLPSSGWTDKEPKQYGDIIEEDFTHEE